MTSACLPPDDYELSRTNTAGSDDHKAPLLDDDDDDFESHLLSGHAVSAIAKPPPLTSRFVTIVPAYLRHQYRSRRRRPPRLTRSYSCSPRSILRTFALFAYSFTAVIVLIVIFSAVFFPGYTHLPPHYARLRQQALASTQSGRANGGQQKVFIAATIYDRGARLTGGPWAKRVLGLVHLLGAENVHLSIYVNDSGPESQKALDELGHQLKCNHSLVYDEHVGFDEIPHVKLPDGSVRTKRIAYLAEVRNRALRPLETSPVTFDKLLYLNDVVFDPIDAAQLLFSTNVNAQGIAEYRAACAVDFINPFKFYDTFATRDVDGYAMGLPFFPWFSANGDERSHQDVVDQKDAVRVRSCWGGMVAFDARFFQPRKGMLELVTAGSQSPSNLSAPYRFRAEEDLYWDASECCLIQADIQNPEPGNTGIYMNPFVRVAYDAKTLSWLPLTRRFERLYTPIHFLLDILVSAPGYNPRRYHEPWQLVEETVWVPDERSESGGSFQQIVRPATHTGFCGRRKLQVMKENITVGERNWEFLPVPP